MTQRYSYRTSWWLWLPPRGLIEGISPMQMLSETEGDRRVQIVPGTEVMVDAGNRHFVKSAADRLLVPQPSSDPRDPLVRATAVCFGESAFRGTIDLLETCKELEHFLENLDDGICNFFLVRTGVWPPGNCAHVSPAGPGVQVRSAERGTIHRHYNFGLGI